MDKDIIVSNSRAVLRQMKRMCRYTFSELQRLCELSSVDLCMALIKLIQDALVEQNADGRGVYYMLAS